MEGVVPWPMTNVGSYPPPPNLVITGNLRDAAGKEVVITTSETF